jgi:S-adenosylmethionine hydrolase
MARYLGSSHYFNTARVDTPMLFITDFGIPYMSDIYTLACDLAPQGLEAMISDQYPAFDYGYATERFFHEVNGFMKTYPSKSPLPVIGVIDPDKNTKRIVVKLIHLEEKTVYMAIPDNGLISRFATDKNWRILEAREIKDLDFLQDSNLRKSEKSLWDGFDRFTP